MMDNNNPNDIQLSKKIKIKIFKNFKIDSDSLPLNYYQKGN